MAAINALGPSTSGNQVPLLTIVQGNSQTTPGYETFSNPLDVLVEDRMGKPVSKSVVVFTISTPAGGNAAATFSGGASVALATAGEDGLASCASVITAGPNVGEVDVTAKCGASLPVTFSLSIIYPLAASIVATSGDNQFLSNNQQSQPLVVTVYDKAGNLVHDGPNSQVTFQCTAAYLATFPGSSATTTSPTVQGVATSPDMTSDNTGYVGQFQVIATIPANSLNPSVTFNGTVT